MRKAKIVKQDFSNVNDKIQAVIKARAEFVMADQCEYYIDDIVCAQFMFEIEDQIDDQVRDQIWTNVHRKYIDARLD